MGAPRLIQTALVTMLTLLAAVVADAQTTCVPLATCPSDNQYGWIRDPYSSKTWFIGPIPGSPHGDRIYLLNTDVEDHIRKAMRVFSNLDYAVPYDYTSTSSGDVTYGWGWVPQSDIQSDPNRRTGIPAAGMALSESNCRINYSVGKFAYNASDGVRLMCWTGDWCNPPWCNTTLCGDTTNIDLLSAAVHEYGHALGFDHSTTSGASMFRSMSTQDSTGRFLLACEANKVVSTYHDNNPAATVTGYRVTRDGGGITVSWLAEQESSTDHYIIEWGPDWNGPFTSLMNVSPNGTGSYTATIPGGTPGIYRLSEVELDGDVWSLKEEPDADPGALPQFEQQSIDFDSTLMALFADRVMPQGVATGPTQYYIYCPDSLRATFQALADTYTQWGGVPAEVVTFGSIGGPTAAKAHIASHLPSGGWILWVGDAWEGYDMYGQPWRNHPPYYQGNGFTPDPWPAQPQLNISPVTYRFENRHQSVSMNYWTPVGMTPSSLVDHNNDGLPDPGFYLGYAPVSNRIEAEVFVTKAIQVMFRTPNPPANMMPPAVFMTYGRNYGSNSGARALAMSTNLVNGIREVNPYLLILGVTTSDANPLGTTQRNAAMKARFDGGMSNCVFVSTVSQRYELGAYAHVDIPGYYFDVNSLASNGVLSFGVGVTCEMGFTRTENPSFGTPVTERLLLVPNRGFWGYVGPDRGSFQGGNERYGQIFLRRQYSTPIGGIPPTVGELWNESLREMAAFKPDSVLATSYLLVGDPHGRIENPGHAVVDVGQAEAVDAPLRISPNPNRGHMTFAFSLAKPASVDLSIYDLAGRRVASVVRGQVQSGPQLVRWDGRNTVGTLVSSGIYLANLKVGPRRWQQKLVMVR